MLLTGDPSKPLTAALVLRAAFPAQNGEFVRASVGERAVHIIPQAAEPRWIIVGDPHKALPVLRSWRPWNRMSRYLWRTVIFAASIKMLPRIPGIENLAAGLDFSYWHNNVPELSESGNVVIHVGSRSFTRKATLFFFAEDQPLKFVAKVPLEAEATCAIFNEAATLLRLKDAEYLPRVFFQDLDRGIAVQSWLEGTPVSRGFTEAHLDLLSLLAIPGGATRVSEFMPAIAAHLDKLDLPFDRSLLATALEVLNFDELLQSFVEHRDFAPWNLKWLANGKLGLVDWEWSVAESLPWQDACQFFYLDDAHFNGPGRVWETLISNPLLQSYRRRFDIPATALPALTMHYLLRVLCMDWKSGNDHLARYAFAQIQSLLANHRIIAAKP